MEQEQALEIIDRALQRVKALRNSTPNSAEHVQFVQSTGLDLARIFGEASPVTKNFAAIRYRNTGPFLVSAYTFDEEIARRSMAAFQQGLTSAEGILLSAREQLLEHGADKILRGSRLRSKGASVFISHGRNTDALRKVEQFVRAIGANPVIVIREASEGMSVDALVQKRMTESDCAIVLATADEQVGDRRQPRPNVLHEIGLAQQVLENRVIYLKEVGCEFPSNVSPKIWESFSEDNMEAAFEKISKELRAFDLL